MTTTDRAALLERAADRARGAAERLDDAISHIEAVSAQSTAALCVEFDETDQDADALAAWAAELRAEPPWLDAPDGPGEWWRGRPDTEADPVNVVEDGGRLWGYDIGTDESDAVPVEEWNPECRWSRRIPVIVPPSEATP